MPLEATPPLSFLCLCINITDPGWVAGKADEGCSHREDNSSREINLKEV